MVLVIVLLGHIEVDSHNPFNSLSRFSATTCSKSASLGHVSVSIQCKPWLIVSAIKSSPIHHQLRPKCWPVCTCVVSAYFAFLYYLLGWSSFAALGLVFIVLPIVRYYSRSVYRMSRRIPIERDKRVSVIRELIQTIKAIKLNAWEDIFQQRAASAREQELKWVLAFHATMGSEIVNCPTALQGYQD